MGRNRWNLALRFVLEVSVLVAVGAACWSSFQGTARWIGAVGGPLLLILVWGVFNVPGDPSRGGGAPVPVSGRVRLFIELGFFAVGVAAVAIGTGSYLAAAAFAVIVIIHYVLALDRVGWLLTR